MWFCNPSPRFLVAIDIALVAANNSVVVDSHATRANRVIDGFRMRAYPCLTGCTGGESIDVEPSFDVLPERRLVDNLARAFHAAHHTRAVL